MSLYDKIIKRRDSIIDNIIGILSFDTNAEISIINNKLNVEWDFSGDTKIFKELDRSFLYYKIHIHNYLIKNGFPEGDLQYVNGRVTWKEESIDIH